jgi:hypothetical protein
MFRSTRPLILGGIAVAVLGACSAPVANGSAPAKSDKSAVATTAPVAPDAPTTIAAAAPTTVAPAPPTTTVPVEDQVRADFDSDRLAREQCSVDPTTCDYAAIAVSGSPIDVQMHELVWMRVQLNVRTKPGFGQIQSTIENVSVAGDTAQLTVCAFDTAAMFEIHDPANPDDDTVFDDVPYSTRSQWEMKLTNGRWLMVSNVELERGLGGALCGL